MTKSKQVSIFIISILAAMLFAPVVFADHTTLTNNAAWSYQIDPTESEVLNISGNGLTDACSSCAWLAIDTVRLNASPSSTAMDGRELVTGIQVMSGLNVSRRSFVPQDANFVRQLNILENTTAAPITVTVRIEGSFTPSPVTIEATSSGDTTPGTDDFSMVTSTTGTAVIGQVWGSAGAAETIDAIDATGGVTTAYGWEWQNVSIGAGETAIFMNFILGEAIPGTATTATNNIASLANFNALFEGVTLADLGLIRNWSFADTDSDGMPDAFETNFGLDPAVNDSNSDLDGDGLTNLAEFNAGTEPNNADTDNDGLSDGVEVNTHGTSPTNSDTDGDDIADGVEILVGLDPLVSNLPTATAVTSITNAYRPAAAVDSNGRTYLVWQQETAGTVKIFFKLLAADGSTLIDSTAITDDTRDDHWPAIAVHSDGRAFVVYQGSNQSGLFMLGIDPSTDDLSGDGANAATLVDVAETTISATSGEYAAIVMDSTNNAHILYQNSGIFYTKRGSNGSEAIAPFSISTERYHSTVDIVVDSSNNAHLLWSDATGLSNEELYYAMVHGGTGVVMIAPTLLTADDGEREKHSTLQIDSSNMLHLVWGSGRLNTGQEFGLGGEIFYAKLDPSLDDQNGDAANPAVIKVVADTAITADDGIHSWYPRSQMDSDGNIVVSFTENADSNNELNPADVFVMTLAADGSIRNAPTLINKRSFAKRLRAYANLAGDKLVWVDKIGATGSEIGTIMMADLPVSAASSGAISASADRGVVTLLNAMALTDLSAEQQAALPTDVEFPNGFFSALISGVPVGGTVNLTVTMATAPGAEDVLYKYDGTSWNAFTYTAGSGANDIVIALVDGGAGDLDGVANGVIVDPAGLSVAPAPDTGSGGGGGGGCVYNPESRGFDPLFPLMLVAASIWFLRRRKIS